MKRILIFLATNLAIMVMLGLVVNILGLNRFLTSAGLNLPMLLGFAAVMGFGGSFISLAMSKSMAKWSTGAQVIEQPANQTEAWLVEVVRRQAQAAGVAMPEVAIYEGEPNAFATGPSRNNSLVAVSTGLLQSMAPQEVEAVLAHEMSHVANGDMVTLTLIQGVVNTFVFFLARVVGYLVDNALRKDDEEAAGPGMAYMVTTFVCDLVFGFLASFIVMYFSRVREFRADAGAARLMGTPQPMVAALQRLGGMQSESLPANMAASGIAGGRSWMSLLASHPSIEERIAALQSRG
ncbi:protease HtpX [Azospira inquinata]|uniref:Protease HtpX homolog n=1 Tax=Azospira inquinata TaxID=2785627 RepID=A0A975SKL4_9RHOO|nr:protease HtpX [Azospira inquinata]QWT46846.1 protease HtpX [Azospira inquinata]QWT47831.1 protease HtpX [Azospira inquinata]